MPNQNLTDISVILDRSGSMRSVQAPTIEGYNTFLKDQKEAAGAATFTLRLFDDALETPIDAQDIKTVRALTIQTYVLRGNTALLDAMGRTIVDTGARLAAMAEDQRPAKVVVVVITDGLENASRDFTRESVFAMVTHQKAKYGWEFIFMGAEQNAIAEAEKMGMDGGKAMTYAKNSEGVREAYRATSSNLRSFRAGTGTTDFSEADRLKQREAGEPNP